MCLFGVGLDRASLPLRADLLVGNSTNDRPMTFFQELSGQFYLPIIMNYQNVHRCEVYYLIVVISVCQTSSNLEQKEGCYPS